MVVVAWPTISWRSRIDCQMFYKGNRTVFYAFVGKEKNLDLQECKMHIPETDRYLSAIFLTMSFKLPNRSPTDTSTFINTRPCFDARTIELLLTHLASVTFAYLGTTCMTSQTSATKRLTATYFSLITNAALVHSIRAYTPSLSGGWPPCFRCYSTSSNSITKYLQLASMACACASLACGIPYGMGDSELSLPEVFKAVLMHDTVHCIVQFICTSTAVALVQANVSVQRCQISRVWLLRLMPAKWHWQPTELTRVHLGYGMLYSSCHRNHSNLWKDCRVQTPM